MRFYATGSYQRCVKQEYNCGKGQSTVHKYVHLITDLFLELIVPNKIQFPTTEEEHANIKNNFFRKWGFPWIIGAVDGTHIGKLKPITEEHNFINRKGFFFDSGS